VSNMRGTESKRTSRRKARDAVLATALGAALLMGIVACTGATPTAPPPTASPSPTTTFTPAPPTATPTPSASPTPDPFAGLTIDDLRSREYGEGVLSVEETLAVTDAFTRTLVSYPSDGLTVHAFLNVPTAPGPHPVVLVLHGYVNPARYQTLAYTTRYADALARAGYLVLHPNYRNHPPSESGDNRFRVGYAVDVLNLVGIVRRTAGEGALAGADPEDIALFGHSMGGAVAIRAVAVDPEIDAAVLYGSSNADDRLNYERWGGDNGVPELEAQDVDLRRVSPVHHLDRIEAALSVHHGDRDADVPLAWSEDLCARLEAIGKPADCFTYPGQGHIFWGESDALFLERVTDFFDAAFASP